MKQLGFAAGICLLFCLSAGVQASEIGPIRVLIRDHLRGLHLTGQKVSILADKTEISIDSEVYVTSKYRDWALKESARIRSAKADRLVVEGVDLQLDGVPVPNRLILISKPVDRVRVVAEVDLETYLKGVIPAEMPARWPLEALKAQAVVSRSYALAIARERKAEDYHLEATILHQVFDYSHFKGLPKSMVQKIEEAVRSTKSQVVIGESNLKLVKTYYHSDCGGRTEVADAIWKTGESTKTVFEPQCALNGKSEWSLLLPKTELARLVGVSAVDSLLIHGRTQSGRIAQVVVSTAPSEQRRIIELNDFRRLVGFQRVKSGFFEINQDGEAFRLTGRGNGHGVGLCQMGARNLAKAGQSYQDILKRYYPGSRVSDFIEMNRLATGL